METENIDRLFLELSQVTKATTEKELRLEEQKAMLSKHIVKLTQEVDRLQRMFSVATNNNDILRDRIDVALLSLEEIRTEKLAAKGLAAEASAVSAARVILQSKCEAAGTADEKPDGLE